MQIGDLLLSSGLATKEDLDRAREHQKEHGGRLGDNLVALGVITPAQLDGIIYSKPPALKSIEESGLTLGSLLAHLVKTVHASNLETPSQMEAETKLPPNIVKTLVEEAIGRKFIQVLGAGDDNALAETRYELSKEGRAYAVELLEQSQYVGPAPVSLEAYCDRILRQRVTNERIGKDRIESAFSDLVVSEEFVRRLGPAINSGRCILLYGPPGNGKTTVAEKVGRIFADTVYIPYAIEVDGQIIKVYDPSIHIEVKKPAEDRPKRISVLIEDIDRRWVACQRPIIVAGGELTLEMLDLKFNSYARFYEAPLHLKALSGTFIIDDFGRQIVSPEEILNRWIVPLQSRVDYLKLHTGKSFSVPFDELVIFSTNMSPSDLMDPAFLRRIPYKLKTVGPTISEYREIFARVAGKQGLELSDDIFQFVLNELRMSHHDLACYQPIFIVDQVLSACKYEDLTPNITRELVEVALANLYVRDEPDPNPRVSAAA